MDLIEKVDDNNLKERLYNCLLINKHFINVLERKAPDFVDYTSVSSTKSLNEKEDICKKFAKSYWSFIIVFFIPLYIIDLFLCN